MEKANNIYYGDIYWLLEAFKKVNKDFNFDSKLIPLTNYDEIMFYECIVIQEQQEDSLYIQVENNLYEYFSNDKCDLIFKLMKIYENRFLKKNSNLKNVNKSNVSSVSSILPTISIFESKYKTTYNKTNKIQTKTFFNSSKLNSNIIFGNLLLVYKDNSYKWLYDYELKKLLFYLKFLPNFKNLKVIRIFPLHIKVNIINVRV
jgi:hypothetical protein